MRRVLVFALLINSIFLLLLVTIAQDVREQKPQSSMFFNNDGKFYRMRPDGIERTALLNGHVGRLTWSPDNRTFVATVQESPMVRFRRLFQFNHMGQIIRPITEDVYQYILVQRSPRNEEFIVVGNSSDISRNVYIPSKLFYVTQSGRDVREITPLQADPYTGEWTPDGEWIVVSGEYGGGWAVLRLRPDGTEFKMLGTGERNQAVVGFLEDGEWVVYLGLDATNITQIFRSSIEGGQRRQLTNGRGTVEAAQLSPDGQWIVYQTSEARQSGIYRIRPDGTDHDTIIAENAFSLLDFSVDGSLWFYYLARNGEVADLYRVELDDRDLQNMTRIAEGVSWHINWSPDQRWLAYIHANDVLRSYDTQTNTSYLIGIQSLQQFFYGQIWSPDNEWVYFVQHNGDEHILYRRRPDGRDHMSIMEVSADFEIVGWSPVIDLDWAAKLLAIFGLGAIGGSLCVGYWLSRS